MILKPNQYQKKLCCGVSGPFNRSETGRDGMGWDRTGWDGHVNMKISEKFQLLYHSYAKSILENTLLWSFRSIHKKRLLFYFGYSNRSLVTQFSYNKSNF